MANVNYGINDKYGNVIGYVRNSNSYDFNMIKEAWESKGDVDVDKLRLDVVYGKYAIATNLNYKAIGFTFSDDVADVQDSGILITKTNANKKYKKSIAEFFCNICNNLHTSSFSLTDNSDGDAYRRAYI